MQRDASIEGDALPVRGSQGGSTPTASLFRKADWWVGDVSLEFTQRFIERHHYAAGGSNTRVHTHGLYPRDSFWESQCVGVAWWIPPTKSAAKHSFPENWQGVLCLSRLAVRDEVPKNAESFLISHSMRMIDRKRWPCFLTFADSWRGHDGAIYKACGWTPAGETKPERRYVRNGVLVCRKSGPKTRTHAEMLAIGCEYIGAFRAKRFIHKAA